MTMTITITMTITTTPPKKRTSKQPRKLKICVWTHLGLIKWKTTSKKLNGRQPQKKMEDDLKKIKMKTTSNENGRGPQKNNGKLPKFFFLN
jgi:hypothetical protein